jgi:tripartite-type tricarboxylate transporter receptor subunit TctC
MRYQYAQFRQWLSLLAIATLPHGASGQNYPVKLIRVIVPFAAGGPADVLARSIGQQLSENLGQSVIIDDKPGANSNLGMEIAAKAPPDGYTLLLTANTLTINPALYPSLTYDAVKDFSPITLVAESILVLVANPALPAKSVKELIALAKARPGEILYGSPGSGSPPHLAGEMFNTLAGVKLTHVPYKGVTGAFTDLLGNQISLMFPAAPLALPQVKAGKLYALATTGIKRSPAAPDLPTMAEAGLPGYDVIVWYGVLAPSGTPAPIVSRVHNELVKALQSPKLREQWATLGADPISNTPEQFATFIKNDVVKWKTVVHESGARID